MKYRFLLAIIISPFFCNSQSITDSVQLHTLLFNNFIGGSVLLKSGQVEQAMLNYNTDNQNIVFIKDGQYLALSDLEAIDTIYIDDKKFVPVKKAFYEVLTPELSVPLFVSYSNKISPLIATVDHNGNSKQSGSTVSNTISDTYLNRTFKGRYNVQFRIQYWIKKGYTLHKANNEKHFTNLFPQKKWDIHTFIAENQINFENRFDIVRLAEFCNTLNKK